MSPRLIAPPVAEEVRAIGRRDAGGRVLRPHDGRPGTGYGPRRREIPSRSSALGYPGVLRAVPGAGTVCPAGCRSEGGQQVGGVSGVGRRDVGRVTGRRRFHHRLSFGFQRGGRDGEQVNVPPVGTDRGEQS